MIAPGTRIGPYEVIGQIGAGGMGEVYRARDTRLKRDVALKILPETFAMDSDRLARFQREAEVLASLNHPNIAAIHGLEEANSTRALVMELVEGPTLADRIAQGPIPVDEALPIAKQIAEGLEAAHEQGIIHRDLKPANIKLRPDGTVKVLDFGLAKALEPVSSSHIDATASPTISSPAMTGVGVLLGTAAYMSPEQARGKAVDKRADIWAFGCVLYEMLTGKRPFDGEDIADTLAAVLRADPDWALLPAGLPLALRTMLSVSLAKDGRRRVSDIGVVLFILAHAGELVDRVEVPTAGASGPGDVRAQTEAAVASVRRDLKRSSRRRVALFGGAGVLLGAAIAGAAVWFVARPSAPLVRRLGIPTVGASTLSIQVLDRNVAITPDGSRVLYRGVNQLLMRAMDQLEPTVLSGLGAPRQPFVSPDGQWVGFFDGNSPLKKAAISGGPPVTLTAVDGNGPRGASWGDDGTIVYATVSNATGLHRVSAAGGEPTILTRPNRDRGEADHLWPEFLPGSRAVLFTILPASGGPSAAQIAVLELATGTYKVLIRGGSHAQYAATGHLVYGVDGTLRAVPFDLERLEITGTPVPVLQQVRTTLTGAADVALAASGTLVYLSGPASTLGQQSLVWVDRMGREEAIQAPPRAYFYPRISPDGTRVALDVRDQDNDIWIWDLARRTLTRLTSDPSLDGFPVWTPDSRRLVFASQRSGPGNLFWQAADGTDAPERLTTDASDVHLPLAITRDGSRLIFRNFTQTTGQDLMLLPLQALRQAQALVKTNFSEPNAEISPDERWLAYESTESGRPEVYIRPFPDVNGGRWQVSTEGGRMPLWARDGRELYYVGADTKLMGVRVVPGRAWGNSAPTRLFLDQPAGEENYMYNLAAGNLSFGGTAGRTFDIAPDGRFLMIKREGAADSPALQNLVVVLNWDQELKRLVPVN